MISYNPGMIYSVNDWLSFLNSSDTMIGVPFIIAGTALMMFGWRFWKVCVMISFALVGTMAGAKIAVLVDATQTQQILYSVGCATLLGVCSYWPAKHALILLAGLIGAALLSPVVSGLRIQESSIWAALAIAFICSAAYALIYRQLVVVFVTAFLGAILITSGLTVFIMEYPPLYGTLRSLTDSTPIIGVFILLVPASVSCFYQIAEVRRLGKEL